MKTLTNMNQLSVENATSLKNGKSHLYDISNKLRHEHNLMKAQHEAIKRTALLKHRKVSTQLKLDVLQRQLSNPRRSARIQEFSDEQFYQDQLDELTNQLKDIGQDLERAERDAYFARRRLIRKSGLDFTDGFSSILSPLSTSQPSIAMCNDHHSEHRFFKSSLKSRALHTLSSPRMKRKHFAAPLRTVASLSSLRSKSPSPSHNEDSVPSAKDTKGWKGHLRQLGHFMDSHILKRFGFSVKRTKSAETILDNVESHPFYKSKGMDRTSSLISDSKNPFLDDIHNGHSSCSESEASDEEHEPDEEVTNNHEHDINTTNRTNKTEIDPSVLAEIEEFEKMAARYINQHKQEFPT